MAEKELYKILKEKFEKLFKNGVENIRNVYLEITADRKFSNRLREKIPHNREIIFVFLREIAPDITGFIERETSPGFTTHEFIVIEVKDEPLKIDHVYQTRKYAELFDAKFAFLVTTQEIPEELKRLSRVVYSLLSLPGYRRLTLTFFDKTTGEFVDWFEGNPFERR